MTYLVLDVETTISNKGNPFDQNNKLCYIGINNQCFPIDYKDQPYGESLNIIQQLIDNTGALIGFNIKFDLHWIRKYGINFSNKRIWDCQIVHFIITGQTHTYPSLNDVAEYYGLGTKLDVVAEEYWKNSIDTTEIPSSILEPYLIQDLALTEQIYLKQLEEVGNNLLLQRLISLHNQDLLVLEEMEFNGLYYNEKLSKELADELELEIIKLNARLFEYHKCNGFNPNSVDHISSLLYGGSIKLHRREAIGFFKTGNRKGEIKEKWVDYEVPFERLVRPLVGSELAKEGYYSTDEHTLRSLKGNKKAKEIIDLLLTRADLEKRVSTYYRGLVNLREQLNWEEGKIYGQLNQCVARTGRLSSSRPNLQNFDGSIKELFYSRYLTG